MIENNVSKQKKQICWHINKKVYIILKIIISLALLLASLAVWVIFEWHKYIINRVQNFRCYISMFQFDRSISDLVAWQDNNTAVWTVCCVLGIAHILSSFSQQTSQCQSLRTFHFKSELSEHFLSTGLLVSHMYILCFYNKVLTIRSITLTNSL